MKKMSPQQFRGLYLIGILVPILLFLVFFIVGGVLIDEANYSTEDLTGWTLMAISLVFFLVTALVFIIGHKRFRTINEEIIEEKLAQPHNPNQVFNVLWVEFLPNHKLKHGNGVRLQKEGLLVQGDDTLHRYDQFPQLEMVKYQGVWLLALGNDTFNDETWTGFLVFPDSVLLGRIEALTGRTINQDYLNKVKQKNKEVSETLKKWGINWLLLIEKFSFVAGIMGISIALGVYLSLTVLDMTTAITLVNLISVPSILLGYPLLFRKAWKFRFMVTKEYFGFARGREFMVIPFKLLHRMKTTTTPMRAVLIIMDQKSNDPVKVIPVPKDPTLMATLKEYKEKYQLSFIYEE